MLLPIVKMLEKFSWQPLTKLKIQMGLTDECVKMTFMQWELDFMF